MTLADYDHIIWDWNGTLLDDVDLAVEVINILMARRQMPQIDHHAYVEQFGFPVIDYYRRLGFDFRAESFEKVVAPEFITEFELRRFSCDLHDGAINALRRVGDSGVPQSLLSATQTHSLREYVEHFGIREHFTELVGLDDHYASGKTEAGRAWLKRSGCLPARVLMVGDTVHDYEVARDMGIDCVLVSHGHHPAHRLEACGVPVCNSLKQVLDSLS